MAYDHKLKKAYLDAGLFVKSGAYVLVDGQFGSTGKGLVAAALAEMFHDRVTSVTCNAGPNSGHTSYVNGEKIVLCQLPTFGVVARKFGSRPTIQMNAGAIIDSERLEWEIANYASDPFGVFVSGRAALVNAGAIEAEKHLKNSVGSTGKGTGAALAAKIMRQPGATWSSVSANSMALEGEMWQTAYGPVFVEVSQGFSLSLNAAPFYPYCTSRDCTVGQALSDAGIHPKRLQQTIMVVRTYPIRVGGQSGPCYDDQKEILWSDIGVEPEVTTVTKKQRRLFTWSREQFRRAVAANEPDHIVLNFANYLKSERAIREMVSMMIEDYNAVLGWSPTTVAIGRGPNNNDLELVAWEGMIL